MNKRLQAILDLLQQSESLTPEEKKSLADAVNESDKEISITEFKLERTEKVKRTTAILLEQTIAELEQKRKSVEAQNRELEIEASLERVRSRSMAMHHSIELANVASALFHQLYLLGIINLRRFFIMIYDESNSRLKCWYTNEQGEANANSFSLPLNENPAIKKSLAAWKNQEPISLVLSGTEMSDFVTHLLDNGYVYPKGEKQVESFVMNEYPFSFGQLNAVTYEPLVKVEFELIGRFAKVFEQTYTRFLDLEQAESQAREAQIQLALERVRARTMAMQHSNELKDAASVLFQQVKELGIDAWTCGYSIWDEDRKSPTAWLTRGVIQPPFKTPLTENQTLMHFYEAAQKGESLFVEEVGGETLTELYRYLGTLLVSEGISDEIRKPGYSPPTFQVNHVAYFSYGYLLFVTYKPYPEAHDIFRRFAKVFDQTYTRFLDLQRAETQVREAQIEAALERVRSRSLAMHKGEELNDVLSIVAEKMIDLKVDFNSANILIFDDDTKGIEYWTINNSQLHSRFFCPYVDYSAIADITNARANNCDVFTKNYHGEEKAELLQYLFEQSDYKKLPDDRKQLLKESEEFTALVGIGKRIGIQLNSYHRTAFSEEEKEIIRKFTIVFEQTYVRFLDLQKAEAQARESRIEAALEKVRSRSLAMHSSDELREVVKVVFDKLQELNFVFEDGAVNICTFKEHSKDHTQWAADPDHFYATPFEVPYSNHSLVTDLFLAKDSGIDYFSKIYPTEEKNEYFKYLFANSNYRYLPEEVKSMILGSTQYGISVAIAKNSMILVPTNSGRLLTESEKEILKRFAKVFEQTYTRFLDLQKAEAQAREAQIEAALERVRSRTMGMQKSEDLKEIIQDVYEQFRHLNIAIDHAGFIIDYKLKDEMNIWLADPHEVPTQVTIPYFDSPHWNSFNEAKEKGLDFFANHLSFEEKNRFYDGLFLVFPGVPDEAKKYYFSCPGLAISTVLLENVGLYIENFSGISYSDEDNATLMRFGKVFQQTYTRFLDLKKAEAQVREAQIETALEKVRSRSLAMHHSDELEQVVASLFDRLVELGLSFDGALIFIFDKEKRNIRLWIATSHLSAPVKIDLPYDEDIKNNAIIKDLWNAIENGEHIFNRSYSGETKNDYFRYVSKYNESKIPESVRKIQIEADSWTAYFAAEKNSIIGFDSWSGHIITTEDFQTLIRFARVFEQTYTRFLDLQKAESQARESQIQLALERVRARTMAMHKSEELAETAHVLFQQLIELGGFPDRISIGIADEPNAAVNFWTTDQQGSHLNHSFRGRLSERTTIAKTYEAWKEQKKTLVIELQGEELKEWIKFAREEMGIAVKVDQIKDRRVHSLGFFSHGWILVTSHEPQSTETIQILERFASVFNLTYRRFLDLQKAEAQAREAQIEAALEKIRGRSLAMHRSDELKDVVAILFEKLKELGLVFDGGAGVKIFSEGSKDSVLWVAVPDTMSSSRSRVNLPYVEDIFLRNAMHVDIWQARENGTHLFNRTYSMEEKNEYFNYVFAHNDYIAAPQSIRDYIMQTQSYTGSEAYEKNTAVVVNSFSGELISEKQFEILKRFSRVFEQAYTRFLDLQKAEAQTREAQIEAALERVRARTMAMQKSDELADVAGLMFQQVKELGISAWTIGFNVWSDDNNKYTDYITSPLGGFIEPYTIDTTLFPSFKEISDAKKSGQEFYVQYLEGDVLRETYLELSKFGDKDQYVKMREGGFDFPTHQFDHFVFLSNISLMFITYNPVPEAHDIFKRFGKVFEQTYTRFLDLQKAEAQAREAKIEASLERVRSKTMAMHNSHDVGDTVVTMFDELVKLGVNTNRCGVLIHSDSIITEVWTAKSNPDEKATLIVGLLDTTIHPMLSGARNSWAKKESFFSYELAGEDIKSYYKVINDSKDYRYRVAIDALPAKEIHSDFHFREGSIFAFTAEPIAEDASRIFSRFAGVFGQTYTRFLDLQKAEAQTREAQIEAALERIRSRALAMHSSSDLIDVANVLREQMGLLGQPELESSIVHLYQDNSHTFEAWYAYRPPNLSSGKIITGAATVPSDSSEWSKEVVEKYKSGDNEYTIVSTGEKIREWYKVLQVVAPAVVEYDHEGQLIFPEILYYHFSKFSGGALLMISNQQPSVEARELQRRAAVVFGLAVTRFLDLKRTEEQAREAQIEASLERVRGKAMAMHSSEDLAATIGIFYRELESFSITPRRCGVGVVDKETRIAELSTMNTTDKGGAIEVIGKLKMEGHPVLEGIFDSWILQQEYHPVLRGNEIKEYYQLVRPQISFPEYPNDAVQFGYFFPVPELSVYAWTEKELAEDELKIYRRFTSVLSLTHKRYKDLKDAEFRAKEAVKQATIDRVRAEIASMRTKQDLDRITPLIWNELTILGIPFVRCGVFIMDDKHQVVHTFLSTPDGKAIAAFQLDYSVSNLKEAIRHWHDRLVYVTHWGEIEFGELADILMAQGSIVSRDQYLNTLPREGIHLHFLPFMQGMLYVGNTTRLQEEDIHLLQSLAEAFSTAYARYEDFNKLEAAKRQVDQALVELRQTQQQLVQAEKMASLGELTAGIAHEIQNPLNFVNNFAEVSNELIDEMVEEVKKGNFDEAKVIAIDVKQNLEKINHHGKRADGIVKSMLQHSRSSSGQKELTDINVLCDEYLRLSYHGLRAKDKSFNAKFETNFDSTLEKINVIPQDIGRVILNLINNAFYAVTEKRKTKLDGYEPTVSLSTRKSEGKVKISVKDNGNGISQKVLDKIFQPFFTTKPTGQGTGLGLSLSYDIIKAHGGEIKVETTPNENTEFIIHIPA